MPMFESLTLASWKTIELRPGGPVREKKKALRHV
jgi:hypothetical protein